jgi:predicted aldo/keto reductase-like oxidoreductase
VKNHGTLLFMERMNGENDTKTSFGLSRDSLISSKENPLEDLQEKESLLQDAYTQNVRFFDIPNNPNVLSLFSKNLGNWERKDFFLSSSYSINKESFPSEGEIRSTLKSILTVLNIEQLDLFYIFGVTLESYEKVMNEVYPELISLKNEGLIRMIGLSESFCSDTSHKMMTLPINSGKWDALIIGYNLLNQSGEDLIRLAREKGIFLIDMYAAEGALINNETFSQYMDQMVSKGKFRFNLSGFYAFKDELLRGNDAVSFPRLAYRFVRDEALFNVVYGQCSNLEKLKDNKAAFYGPSLPPRLKKLIKEFFEGEKGASGQEEFRI